MMTAATTDENSFDQALRTSEKNNCYSQSFQGSRESSSFASTSNLIDPSIREQYAASVTDEQLSGRNTSNTQQLYQSKRMHQTTQLAPIIERSFE